MVSTGLSTVYVSVNVFPSFVTVAVKVQPVPLSAFAGLESVHSAVPSQPTLLHFRYAVALLPSCAQSQPQPFRPFE